MRGHFVANASSAAGAAEEATAQVQGLAEASKKLSQQSETLRGVVDTFLKDVRAA